MSKYSHFKILFGQVVACSLLLCSCGENKPVSETVNTEKPATSLLVLAVKAQKRTLDQNMSLPGQLEAYQNVPIHAKVQGFVSAITVDRGSVVRKGQSMITIACPELDEKAKEAEAKVSSAKASFRESQSTLQSEVGKQVAATAKLDSDNLTFGRLKEAAKTPGAIALNEVDTAQKAVEADRAAVASQTSSVHAAQSVVAAHKENIKAAQGVLHSVEALRSYLTIRAPFDGVITERNVHEGSIVAVDASRTSLPLVRIQQKNRLRLVVAVPEDSISGLHEGKSIPFTVPAFVSKTFYGTVARLGHALDEKTRTMPVELDVQNVSGELEPGMFATVSWNTRRPYETVFLPTSAVATDLQGTFVDKLPNQTVDRVFVKRGQSMNNLVEVIGPLSAGEMVALKATDELKSGLPVNIREATNEEVEKACQSKSSGGE